MQQILIVDDEQDIREVMALVLAQGGYYPLLAESAEMALEHLRSGNWTPDLIIVDERMPRMTGHEFIAHLERENLRIMPIVVFSASHHVPKLCQEAHAEGCLLKPFEMDDLFCMLTSLLGKRVEQLI